MKIELAKSLSGHDKGRIYLIFKKEGNLAYLVNGGSHGLERPKPKNEKHYQVIRQIPENVLAVFREGERLTDERIARAIRMYERSHREQ